MPQNILIRADASLNIGSGHVMRTIALGQMLHDAGCNIHYATIPHHHSLLSRIERPFEIYLLSKQDSWDATRDAEEVIALVKAHHVSWVITDGYHFQTQYQKVIKGAGYKLMCIDDIADCHYLCDILLNQNVHATRQMYSAQRGTFFFLGPQYCLLRREFLEAKQGYHRRISPVVSNILVAMGGADANNATLKVLKALPRQQFPLNVKVVIGDLNPFDNEILTFIHNSPHQIEILKHVFREMPELIKWADLAISAGGSMLWEYASLGTPVLAVVIAKNQEPVVDKLSQLGAVIHGGWYHRIREGELSQEIERLCEDQKLRKGLSENLQSTVTPHRAHEIIKRLVL